MPTLSETLLLAGASGVTGGGLSRLWRTPARNRKDDAESAKALATAYAVLVDDLRKEVILLRDENRLLRDRIISLETKLDLYIRPDQ